MAAQSGVRNTHYIWYSPHINYRWQHSPMWGMLATSISHCTLTIGGTTVRCEEYSLWNSSQVTSNKVVHLVFVHRRETLTVAGYHSPARLFLFHPSSWWRLFSKQVGWTHKSYIAMKYSYWCVKYSHRVCTDWFKSSIYKSVNTLTCKANIITGPTGSNGHNFQPIDFRYRSPRNLRWSFKADSTVCVRVPRLSGN